MGKSSNVLLCARAPNFGEHKGVHAKSTRPEPGQINVFGQLTPTKMSLGELELRQTPLPLCCPKGRVWLAPTPFDTDRRDTRSSDPRRGQELGVRLHVWFPVTDLIPVTAVRARCRAPAGNRGNSSTQRLQTPLPSRGTQF